MPNTSRNAVIASAADPSWRRCGVPVKVMPCQLAIAQCMATIRRRQGCNQFLDEM